MSEVGKDVARLDARLKVTGKATYAAEVAVANVAHAVIVGSAIARGRLIAIDDAAARKLPGVLAVIAPGNAPAVPGARGKQKPNDRVVHVLQDDAIHYSDQPIAVVVADTLERAQHAANLVVPRYDAVAGVIADLERDLPSAYAPETAGPRGPTDTRRGDVDAALATAAARVDVVYTTPEETHNPMEPHATIAVWHGRDRLTIYDSTQGIFNVRDRIAAMFGLAPDHVRVINHYVGGGFGCKGAPWSHVPLAVLAARVVGRPVKLAVTRQQMFSLVGHRPKTVQRLSLGADRRGALVAIRHDVVSETSRFDQFVEAAATPTRILYACPNVATSHRLVKIDVPTPTFTRAPGEASGTFAFEAAMDELAYAARVDPLELRLRNYADKDPESGKPWSSKALRECYQRGAERFGWARRKLAPRSMRDGQALIGWGMATSTYPARQQPASALARLRPDGTALVQAGTQDIGTGTYTIMTQIAADALALPLGKVRFELGDTTFPQTPLSAGSFTASSTGSAVKAAGKLLVEKLVALAIADARSPLSGLAPGDVIAADGALVAAKDVTRRDPYGAIVTRAGMPEVTAEARTQQRPDRDDYSVHSWGATFAEVRVDPELGTVRVARFVGAFAAGRILNPRTARSQLVGGIVWGIGLALHEHTARDQRTARPVTRDLVDYHVPVHADIPDIDIITVHEDDAIVNEIGAKGVGEIGTTGSGAAVANAVFHATGKRIRELPITPDKLL